MFFGSASMLLIIMPCATRGRPEAAAAGGRTKHIVARGQETLRGSALRDRGSKAGKARSRVQSLDKQKEHFRLVGGRPRPGLRHPACRALSASSCAA